MRRITLELNDEHYFFLKEKALKLQKSNHRASVVSIIRELIEKDKQRWNKSHHENQNR